MDITYLKEIYDDYKSYMIAMIAILFVCAIACYFIMHVVTTFDAKSVNLTNESWSYLKNTTIGKPSVLKEIVLNGT